MSPVDRSAAARRLHGLTTRPDRGASAADQPSFSAPAGHRQDEGDRLGAAALPATQVSASGSVLAAVRVAADAYGRNHPDPLDAADDEPAPGGVRRSRETRRVRWTVSWRVAGTAALAVGLVVGAVVLRSMALAPGAAVELPDPSPPVAAGGPASATPAASPGLVVVHVVGAVLAPGVVRLPAGSRVVDAVAAAGGTTGDADLAALNLARVLVDGEQVVVPRPGESAPPAAGAPTTGADALVDLNSASLAQLDELPGVGPVLAQRIVDRRPFTSVDELDEVSGVGQTLLDRLRPLVRV